MIDMLIRIPGQQFLTFFAVWSFACIFTGWLVNYILDDSMQYPAPEPESLDPVTVAALRGGKNAVIRTVVFDLWSQRLLDIKVDTTSGDKPKTTLVSLSVDSQNPKEAGFIHKIVYGFLKTEKEAYQLFSLNNSLLTNHLDGIYDKLRDLHLLNTASDNFRRWIVFLATFTLIYGIGITKLILGITRNRPFGFLVILLVISFIALLSVLKPWKDKPTRLGRRFLKNLTGHLEELKSSIKNHKKLYHDRTVIMAIALFGVGILSDSYGAIYQPITDAFGKSSRFGGGGCGGGCGSASGGCSGGGCSGGCGGCGGGD